MKKMKLFKQVLCGVLSIGLLVGCGGNNNSNNLLNNNSKTDTSSKFEQIETDVNVGLVVGTGSIDDRSFNQGCWEGIKATVDEKNAKYVVPASETDADYLVSIGNLYEGDFKLIITPGYYFERADYLAQQKYPDVNLVILDGAPTDENGNVVIGPNTVSITFAEHEAGFIAGVAAAVELQEADFGFLGGMRIPSVIRFDAGFRQGVNYANTNLGTKIKLDENNIIYQGTFGDKAAGQQIAAQMYDRGIDVIFSAAGDTGIGAITEAKSRATKGETAWVIGVDSDQYYDGIYDSSSNASVILTSAIKYVDQATHDMIVAKAENTFPGGEAINFSIANDGVGIPEDNPNLKQDTIAKVNEIYDLIKKGEIVVKEDL